MCKLFATEQQASRMFASACGADDGVASPRPGVHRYREGDEVVRATSLVRCDAGSHFEHHIHRGGVQFLVRRWCAGRPTSPSNTAPQKGKP